MLNLPDLSKNKKGQAMVEIAIIGSIMILAFSYLITFTAKINMRQELLQNAFQSMLKRANKAGKSHLPAVAYMRMPNILDPYVPGPLSPIKTSGSVLWSEGEAQGNEEVGADDGFDDGFKTKWSENESHEVLPYKKTLTRTENPGEYPQTQRKVEVRDSDGSMVTITPPEAP